jgi:hypothetical protein
MYALGSCRLRYAEIGSGRSRIRTIFGQGIRRQVSGAQWPWTINIVVIEGEEEPGQGEPPEADRAAGPCLSVPANVALLVRLGRSELPADVWLGFFRFIMRPQEAAWTRMRTTGKHQDHQPKKRVARPQA